MDPKKLEFIRRGSRVKRFHGFHLLMENPVGHHTYNMMGILLCCVEDPSPALLKAAYFHDTPECITGDMPAPFKRKVPGLRKAMEDEEAALLHAHGIQDYAALLGTSEARWLKLADSLDGAMHCLEERRLGNTTLDKIFWTFMRYAEDTLSFGAVEDKSFHTLWQYLFTEWLNIGGTDGTKLS